MVLSVLLRIYPNYVQIMSHRCRYCKEPFTRTGGRRHHERYTCWTRPENGQEKLPLVDFPSSPAITREVPKITFPNEKNHGIPNGIKMGEAFRFKTPSSILIVGPSGCGKTCFTESLLLNHLEELRFIIATGRGKIDSET